MQHHSIICTPKNAIYLPPVLELKLDLTEEQFWQLCGGPKDLIIF
ncbi:hypothetical protein [Okeania sp. SIO2C2]|nr:hypothetical protein [Okeania sp. SIO2C2]